MIINGVTWGMAVLGRRENLHRRKISALWVSLTVLDSDLHKTALLHILSQFAEFGHSPHMLAIQSRSKHTNKDLSKRIIAVPLRYVPFISTVMFTFVAAFLLPLYILFSNPDFIIFSPTMSILSYFSGIIASKFRQTKFILDIRSVPVETVGLSGFLTKFWFSVSILVAKKLFDGLTIITPSMKMQISSDYKLNPDTIGVWSSGVSESLFNPENSISEGVNLRRTFGLTGKFVVLYHGSFTPTRALKETIKAVKLLVPKYPDIVFFMLGSGPSSEGLKTLIQQEGLSKNVIISDPVDQNNVPQFINMCHVGIDPLPDHPYWRFQSPLKLLEYLAMEKATILTDIPAHRAVVGNAKCGIYVSSVDPPEIARAIEYAYLHKKNLIAWGKSGRKIVKEGYTWEKVAEDLEQYLLSVDN